MKGYENIQVIERDPVQQKNQFKNLMINNPSQLTKIDSDSKINEEF
jgi:hypothetical protein